MTSKEWLKQKIQNLRGLNIIEDEELLVVTNIFNKEEYRIYVPSDDEYLITVDLVQRVSRLGKGIIICYPNWIGVSTEAQKYAEIYKISIKPYGELLNMLKLG